jgi:uncharacterized protein
MPIKLHIFEPRYKAMVKWCMENDLPFGVVLIEEGNEAFGPLAKPFEIGCIADIVEVETLDEGRVNLGAVGSGRFRIRSFHRKRPFLTAEVDEVLLENDNLEDVRQASTTLRPWVMKYLELLGSQSREPKQTYQLPGDPIVFGNLSASLLQIPLLEKQDLLGISTSFDLLTELRRIYRREIAIVRKLLQTKGDQRSGSISLN